MRRAAIAFLAASVLALGGCGMLASWSPNAPDDPAAVSQGEQAGLAIEGVGSALSRVGGGPVVAGVSGALLGIGALVRGFFARRREASVVKKIGESITIKPDEHADLWKADPKLAAALPPDPA